MSASVSAAWPTVALGEVLTPILRDQAVDPSREYPLLGVRLDGQGPFHRETVLGTQTSAARLYEVRTGDFIYSRLFAWRGAFGLIDPELNGHFVSNEFPTFAPVEGRVDPKFLRYWFRLPDVLRQVEADCSGSTPLTRNRYKERYFFALKIPLPPIGEQQRIVECIERLNSKVEEARALRAAAMGQMKQLKRSALNAIFDGADDVWPLEALPKVATIARGKFAHRPRNDPRFYGGGTPFIQIGDISASNRYIKTYSQTLNEEGVKISRVFAAGTVAIAITGATIGVTGILTFPCAFPDSIVGIEAKSDIVTPEFIYLAVEHAKQKALDEATQTTQPNINLGNLERLRVRVPSLALQRAAVQQYNHLSEQIDAALSLQQSVAAELQALGAAILDKAFKGEL